MSNRTVFQSLDAAPVVLYAMQDTDSSTAVPLRMIDDRLRVSSVPYYVDIAKGNFNSHQAFVKTGYNGALSSSIEDLWSVGGEYVYPSAEMGMEIVSDSVDDTAAGTGIQAVTVTYLDNTYTAQTLDVEMNGTSVVTTSTTNLFRIQAFRAKRCGTGGRAAGNIDIRHLSDTPIYSRIATNQTRARNITYTVPLGWDLYITDVLLSAGSNVSGRPVTFTTKATYDNVNKTILDFFMPYSEVIIQDAAVPMPLSLPTYFPEKTQIKVSAISPDGAAYGACILRGWLEPNT